jgi:hypothetical protein
VSALPFVVAVYRKHIEANSAARIQLVPKIKILIYLVKLLQEVLVLLKLKLVLVSARRGYSARKSARQSD